MLKSEAVVGARVEHVNAGTGVISEIEDSQLWWISDKDGRNSWIRWEAIGNLKLVPKTAEDIQAEFDQFKLDVIKEATRVQQTQGWCDDGLNTTLNNLGLERPKPRRNLAVITVEYTVEFDGPPSHETYSDSFVRSNLNESLIAMPQNAHLLSGRKFDNQIQLFKGKITVQSVTAT